MAKEHPLPEEVRKSFDKTVMVIQEMTAEAATLKEKFGDRSKLFIVKRDQINSLTEFYNTITKYIETLHRHNTHLGVRLMGAEIHLAQELYGLTFVKAAEHLGYTGFSPEFIRMQEEADVIIKDLKLHDKKHGG
jgi:hypothetical protein